MKWRCLDKLDRGMRVVVVRHCYGVNELTISFIKKLKVAITSWNASISGVSSCDCFLKMMAVALWFMA
jgi:hypothetical protein